MEKTMENYIIERLERVEMVKEELARKLAVIREDLIYFKTRFELQEKEDGKILIEIKDKNNEFITYLYDEQARKFIDLLNLLNFHLSFKNDD